MDVKGEANRRVYQSFVKNVRGYNQFRESVHRPGFEHTRRQTAARLRIILTFTCGQSQNELSAQIELYGPRFQASAVMLMKSALFWDVMRRRVVIVYRRFWTCRSHLHGSRVWDRHVVPKRL
jgi:hypothetical protein